MSISYVADAVTWLRPDASRAMAARPSGGRISLSQLRLIAIVAPVAFLAVVLHLLKGPVDSQLHRTLLGFFVLLAILSAIVSTFSFLLFRMIERLERRVLEQNRHLAILNEIGARVAENLELDELLSGAIDKLLEVTGAHSGFVYLIDEATHELTPACRRVARGEARSRSSATQLEHRLLAARAAGTGELLVIEQLLEHPQVRELARREGFRSAIALPLKAEGKVYGVLGALARRERDFRPAEIDLLNSIAGQLGLAARNARLREDVLDHAVVEERERLARELHDSLGQMVGYVNTQTLAIKRLLASGNRDEAERHLAEMEETSQRVGTDVREAILGLRANGGQGLLPSLRMYLADYGVIAGTRVRLEANADVEALGLRESTEIQLIRIVQEALSNVRRHAHARSATVRLGVTDGHLAVEIADDGVGFDCDQLVSRGTRGFGLETMRERAESIGGTIAIVSRAGDGTTVTVHVPLAQRGLEHAGAVG